MASKDSTTTNSQDALPFGTIDDGAQASSGATKKKRPRSKKKAPAKTSRGAVESAEPAKDAASNGAPSAARTADAPKQGGDRAAPQKTGTGEGEEHERRGRRKRRRGKGQQGQGQGQGQGKGQYAEGKSRSRRGKGQRQGGGGGSNNGAGGGTKVAPRLETGMFVLEKGGFGVLRSAGAQYRPSKEDIYVPKRLIDKEKLRDGSIVSGMISRGQKHKFQLIDVQEIDGKPPGESKNTPSFKSLTSIDPDFHYAVGDVTQDVSMRILDLLCPIGRGQRGLIVAPPRSGKTTILRQFAAGIEKGYPAVHLMIVLVDERPEEATEWKRSVDKAQVFVSTADETAKNHIQLAEAAWKRACRLVEIGEDVVILLDSITRLARAYNNQAGAGGRTMSGGLDSRAMERPRKIFGSARNTEQAGSLTILGTTLVDTGSRMDQLVFEEFKGTGNMELVLNRKLADRRVFPAIDVEKTGTRKEEKLVGSRRLKQIHTLRRVLTRMHFVEAMELLITRLEDVDKTDDFLKRFEVDPEA